MEFKDYYKTLGVDEKATLEAIKKAYKKLARRYHPDVSKEKNAEAHFKEVGEAYEVLKDQDKRQEYDQLRAMGAAGRDGQFVPPPGWRGAGAAQHRPQDSADVSDFFESLFGRGGNFQHAAEDIQNHSDGRDIHYELALLLEEAFKGCEQVIELRIPQVDARGRQTLHSKKLKIKVPPGATEGTVLRIKGQGDPGFGGVPGDLLITIKLATHPLYTVAARDIALVVPITPWEAALGCKLTIPTLKGHSRVTIPPQSQAGQKLRLAGLGFPGTPVGDFFVVLKIVMPATITPAAKTLFENLAQELDFNPRSSWEAKP
jgi:curved DNA-binding protein